MNGASGGAATGQACPVVLAAPSGTGKTTLAHQLVDGGGYAFSVSATTRAPRAHERDGVDYVFVARAAFEAMVARGELAEWAEVHGRLYGTPTAQLAESSRRGVHALLDIDVQGARQIRASVPDAVLIFVLPPDVDTLLSRLTGRGSEAPAEVARRLRSALEELQAVEEFDYVVVNDDLDRCLGAIRGIVSGTVQGTGPEAVAGEVETLRSGIRRILAETYADYTD